jgi:sugar/nucleoside kinase (ribokinase family)
MTARLAVVGYLSIDTITTPAGRWSDVPGGAALYAALAAAALGAQVALFATAGADYPQRVLDAAAARGVDIGGVVRSAEPSRRADMRTAADGTRASVTFDAASWWAQTQALLPPLVPGGFDWLVLNPMPAERAAAQLARAAAARVVLDTSEGFARREAAVLRALAAQAHVFAPSREETRLLLPELDDDAAALALAAMGCAVVQKRGPDGAFVVPARGTAGRRVPAPPATVIDTTGAGDATVGALAAALARGDALDRAVDAALAVAARTIAAPGAAALGVS